LLSELNKILIQERRKTQTDNSRDRDVPPIPVETISEISEPVKIDAQGMVELQERETIRLLLNYAEKEVDENTLSDFFLRELDDVTLTNPVYRQIYEDFKNGVSKGEIPNSHYFIQHGSEEVKRTVTDLITMRYEPSKHWGDKFKIHFSKEDELVSELALTNVLRLKFRFVQKLMEDNLQKVKQAESSGTWEDLDEALLAQAGLKEAEQGLAKMLGIVIAR
jgi:DNA primase